IKGERRTAFEGVGDTPPVLQNAIEQVGGARGGKRKGTKGVGQEPIIAKAIPAQAMPMLGSVGGGAKLDPAQGAGLLGGGPTDLATLLQNLVQALQALADAITQNMGGSTAPANPAPPTSGGGAAGADSPTA